MSTLKFLTSFIWGVKKNEIDTNSPELIDKNPDNGYVDVVVDTNIKFSVIDWDSYVDKSSIDAYVDGYIAYHNETFQSGFTGSVTAISDSYDGYAFSIKRTLDYNSYDLVSIRVLAEDIFSNSIDETYSFRIGDIIAPVIKSSDPINGEINVDKNKLITINIYDDQSLIDLSTVIVRISVNGSSYQDAYNVGFVSPYDGGGSTFSSVGGDGYEYEIVLDKTSSFDSVDQVSFSVIAYDNDGNLLSDGYSFTVIDYIPPFLSNQLPTGLFVLPSEHVSFDLLDDYDIDLSTVKISVNTVQIYDGATDILDPAYSGLPPLYSSITGGYHFDFYKIGDFGGGSKTISITAEDYSSNSLTDSWSFTVSVDLQIADFYVDYDRFEITLILEFSNVVDSGWDISSNYTFSNDTYVRLIENVSPAKYRLWVEHFHGDDTITITTNNLVYGGVSFSNSFSLTPNSSNATFSNINGLIRSWHDSNISTFDDERFYISTTKGIDVIEKNKGENLYKNWAQILDGYNIESMFLASFGEVYKFTGHNLPFLSNQIPAPGGFISSTYPVMFRVNSESLAINIQDLYIYIDGILSFAGSKIGNSIGWLNNSYGSITVGYKYLDVSIYSNFSIDLHNITIKATDLQNNILNETYKINVT